MTGSNNKSPLRPLGRWFWLIGLACGVLGGAAVAVGYTSATAAADQPR